ncbi:hypothetical protein IAR55_001345 [Kwoniella newhampshirensis]|uniref:ATP-dependent RNA helicase n=1 Tax=Kwoniella newhampshirensis TaxID=1651941 RepID=A0AAW0Z5E2_9TREE
MSSLPTRGRGQRGGGPRRGGFRPSRGGGNNSSGGVSRGIVTDQTIGPAVVNTQDSTPMASGISTPVSGDDRPRFRDFNGLSQEIFPSLPFETCTEVQAATLPTILAGHDVLAQAKTGTGKTLAFLVPAIQHLLSSPVPPPNTTSILILSPTRELAQQINEVAERMTTALGGRFGTRAVVGGTNMDKDIKDLKSKRVDILVATPGRLLDLLENGGIKARFSQLTDRLLDAGFRRELVKIFDFLPNRQAVPRQTLLFSATLPTEIASIALNKDYKFVTTLTEEDVNAHAHVKQETLVVSAEDVIPATMEALRNEESKGKEFKEAFHQAERGVLFSSDVTARGIDVKGVTAVVQIGLPSSGEQSRAGAEGHGILILGEFESFFLRDKTLQTFTLHPYPAISPEAMGQARDAVEKALASVSPEAKGQAYQAWLGYYNSHLRLLKWSQADLVRHAGDYARISLQYGPEPPGLLAKTVGKMGLKGVPGLKIVKEVQGNGSGQGRGQPGKRERESDVRSGEGPPRRGGGGGGGGAGRGGGGGGGRGGFGGRGGGRGGRGGRGRGAQ